MKVLNRNVKVLANRTRSGTIGFTLIEVVIAISILAVISTVTYGALTQIIRSKNLLDDRRELNAVAYSLLNRITRELQLAYSGIGLMPRPDQSDLGQEPSSVNLIGESFTSGEDLYQDSIRFLALEGGQYLPDGGTHSGLVQIMYRVEENPEESSGEVKTYLLIREETPLIRPFEKAFTKTMNFPIVDSLVSLQFRYKDPDQGEWLTKWEKDKNFGLPIEIEIKLTLLSPNGHAQSFTTSVPIRSINVVRQQ